MDDLTKEELAAIQTVGEEQLADRINLYAIKTKSVLRLLAMLERRDRALNVVMDAIGKPPQGVLMYEGRERILLDAVARAEDILAGKAE